MQLPSLVKETKGDTLQGIKVKKIFPPATKTFGNKVVTSRGVIVVYKEKEYNAFIKEKDFGLFREGASVMAVRKQYQNNDYFEYFEMEGSQPDNHGLDKEDLPYGSGPVISGPAKELPNLAGNGASFNLAFKWCLKHSKTTDLNTFLVEVAEVAEIIKPAQALFVTK